MKKKEKFARLFKKHSHLFRCPICYQAMKVVDLTSLTCSKGHTFDFAKQGYINLLTRAVKSNYDRKLFEARQKIILECNLYQRLHEKISKIIAESFNFVDEELILFDAGCGEGSHLKRILECCEKTYATGIGLDISKEGIRMATSNTENSMWIVGDLANSPLQDQSTHVILNILSPANYNDFKRILHPDGLVIKVVPRANYLIELRNALRKVYAKKQYNNDRIISLFNEHFTSVKTFKLTYKQALDPDERLLLLNMSPLGWNLNNDEIKQVDTSVLSEITIDLDILIGKKQTF